MNSPTSPQLAAFRPPEQTYTTRLPRCGHSGDHRRIPVKPFQGGRKKVIKIRVSEAEHGVLRKFGKGAGGVSALIRRRLLDPVSQEPKRDALRELARLARNLNLIARQSRCHPPRAAVEIIRWLITIDRQLATAVKVLARKRPQC